MRLLKPVLTAVLVIVAVMAGLFASLIIALTGAGVLLVKRLLRFRSGSPAVPHERPPLQPRSVDEPIDVVATEVPVDRQGQ